MNVRLFFLFLLGLPTVVGCSLDYKISSLESALPLPPVSLVPASGQIPFESTFSILNPDEQIILPLRSDSGFTYNISVDWGDGTFGVFSSSDPVPVQHTFENAGSYTVKFWGQAEAFSFGHIPHSKDK